MKLQGPIVARYLGYVPVFEAQKRTAAQREGLRYEAAVLRKLKLACPKMEASPWLHYKAPNKSGICQPDALLWLAPNLICIVEIKLSWRGPARLKLLNFYGPIVQAIYPHANICYMQVFKNTSLKSHKRKLTIYSLDKHKPGVYRECHLLS